MRHVPLQTTAKYSAPSTCSRTTDALVLCLCGARARAVSRGGRGRWIGFRRPSRSITPLACHQVMPPGRSGRPSTRWRRRDLSARRYDRPSWRTEAHRRHAGGTQGTLGFQAGVRAAPRAGVSCWHACAGAGSRLVPTRHRRWRSGLLEGAGGDLFPDTRRQRCWVHKTANVLNKLPRDKRRQT